MHRGVEEMSAEVEMHTVRRRSVCRDLPRVRPGLDALSVGKAEAKMFKEDVK